LQQCVLGELTQVMRRDACALELYRLRQLVKDLERLGPVALRLVDALQVIERRVPGLARGRELLEHPFRAVHEAGALVVESEGEGCLVGEPGSAVVAQPRVYGDRTIDLPAPAEQAPESELDLGGITVGFGHACEDLRGVVEA